MELLLNLCVKISGTRPRRLAKEFPLKKSVIGLGGINKLLKKMDNTGTTDRQLSSGRRRTIRTDANTGLVEDHVQSQEDQPQMHVFQRQIHAS